MANKEITLTALGGLNQDDSLFVPPVGSGGISPFEAGDYRYALNARIGSSIEDNSSSVENFPSTLAITNYWTWNGSAFVSGSAPAGTNTAINKFLDQDENKVYYFVHNSNGDHQILVFVKHERKIYELLNWSELNFDTSKFISCTKINKYLIFTDYNSAPRIVDVTDIYRLKSDLGVNFSEFHISFAKWAPGMPPLVTADTSETNDFMEEGAFQFSYRYVYTGGFKSTLSPPSPFCSNQMNGTNYIFKVTLPGYIYDKENDSFFTHSSIKFYEFVEYIELCYRESSIQPWKLFQRHVVGSGDQVFYFKNNGNISIIPDIDGRQYSDAVPLLSGACEAIDNRPMFSDNLDDFDVPTFEVEDVEVYNSFQSLSWNAAGSSFGSLSAPLQSIKTALSQIQQYSFKAQGIYKLGILYHHHTGRTGLIISPDNWIYQIPNYAPSLTQTQFDALYSLGFNIPAGITPPDWAVGYSIVRTNCLNVDFFVQGICNTIRYLGKNTVVSPVLDYKTLPESVQTIINDRANSVSTSDDIDLSRMLATSYRDDVDVATLSAASRLYFDCNNWINSSKANAGGTNSYKSNDVFYNFKKGDRLKFACYDPAGAPLRAWYDEEILEFTGRGFIINKPSNLTQFPKISEAAWYPVFSVVEVYRPKKVNLNDNFIFYEMGEYYPITLPGTVSRNFSKRDFRWTNQASVTGSLIGDSLYPIFNNMPIISGDVWSVSKTFYFDYYSAAADKSGISAITMFSQMNENPKNAGGTWNHNNGRPFVAYEYLPVQYRKETQTRFGNKFLEDSLFIGINTFLERNQFIYPSEYGRIRAMVNTSNAMVESVGNVLLMIGEIESWSVYVNRTTLEDLSGRSQVSISDKVLGSYNTLLGSHGTLNPESISKESGMVLWWNAKRSVWVRYSRDGLTQVSDYGMKNWFKDLGDVLIDYYYSGTTPKVVTVFDDYHQEWITQISHSTLPATYKGYSSYKCATFAERPADKRWKSIWDYAPDIFASMGNEVYSIIGSAVHIHEQGADFGSIYGVKKDSMLQLVANVEPRKNKVWRSIAETASDKWSLPTILGDWKSNAATRQQSEILLAQLEEKEGTFWAYIRRDGNSPNAASFEAGIVEGNAMRSKTLLLMLSLDPTVDYLSVFHWLNVSYDDSEQNVKI